MNLILPIALAAGTLIIVNGIRTAKASDKLSYSPEKLVFKSFNGLSFAMVLQFRISNPSYKTITIDYYQFGIYDDANNKMFNINCPSNVLIQIKQRTDVLIEIPFSLSTIGTMTAIYQAVKEGGVKSVKIKGTLTANGFPVPIEETIPVNINF